jgi:gliding motility-associated-like protein
MKRLSLYNKRLRFYAFVSKKLLFVFLFSGYGVYASAQCDFNLDAVVVQHTDCAASGIIQVNLSGDEVDLTRVQITLSDGALMNITSSTNNQQFTTLPGGVYTVTASTVCTNSGATVTKTATLTVQSTGTALVAFINDYRKPLVACNDISTGMLSIYIYNGKAPYTVKLNSVPAGYSGNKEFLQNTSGTFVLNNIPAGNYSFSITDNCLYNIPLSIDLQSASNFPEDPFYYYMSIGQPPNNCSEVKISLNNIAGELSYYWNEHRDKYYEVSFSVNGINSEWMPFDLSTWESNTTLPYTFKQMRENQYTVKARLRLKDCPALVEEVDEIYLYDPYIEAYFAEANCQIFQYNFLAHDICYPYTWEIREQETNVLTASGTVAETGVFASSVADLNKKYVLTVTDNDGFQITDHVIYGTQEEMYQYSWNVNFCLPDTFTYDYFFLVQGSKIPAGTRIRQIDGPTVINSDITVDENIEYYYPFSTDYKKQEYVKVKDGEYAFEITNICGDPPFVKTFAHYNFELRDFSYTAQEACDGLRVFPTGEFYYANYPQEAAYYRMITAPAGVDISNYRFHISETDPANKTGRYFLLSKTGRYVFQVSYYYNDCPTDTIVIDYERKDFDIESLAAYTCSSGGMPHFYLSAKNGMPPYKYELIENGVVVANNTTGDFIYGHPDNTYGARITDACDKNITIDLQVVDFFTDAIISGTDRTCLGGTISLSCLSLGASGFHWTGPAGFSSDGQNISIQNITADNAGTYSVTIQPYGCSDPITQSFDVSIYVPPIPSAPDTLMFCEKGDNTLPTFEALPGHSLTWYSEDGVTKCPVPVPNINVAHTEIYYISQKDDVLGCESDKHRVVFIVNPLPSTDINAGIPDVCSGDAPLIEIQNSIKDYVYDIYVDYEKISKLATIIGTGSAISENLSVIVTQNATYYISVTDSNGCVSQPPVAVDASVIELYILPEYLPPYQTGIEYEQILTTNAEMPDFSVFAGQLPNGLTLYSEGRLSGVASESNDANSVFTARVEDLNGCKAFREYKFECITFIPQVFTPDNDGINDVFMPGNRVIIFDRLGIVIYEGLDGWDGTYKGKNAPSDIYFYKIIYMENNITKMKTGYIGLIRK